METAGLVVGIAGLAGLFNSCLEAIDKVQSYQTFGIDSHVLDTRFKAAKARFERWGTDVGIDQHKLLPVHHSALDDKVTSAVVMDVLHIINKAICNGRNASPRRARATRSGDDDVPDLHWLGPNSSAMPESRRRKMTWALWGKGARMEHVELFEKLVQQLHNLIPPHTIGTPWREHNPDLGRRDTSTPETTPTNAWSAEIRRILARIDTKTRREIHSWLGRCSSNELYRDSLQKRVNGTCHWILDRAFFRHWLATDASVGPKLLWVNGPAGFGKTILSAHVVEHLTSNLDTPVAHFFFTSDFESREDPYLALRSWISQIVSCHEGAWDHARQRRESDSDPIAARSTIITLFAELLHITPNCTFISDGIDECAYLGNRSSSVAKFLRDVIDAVVRTNARVLFVSRDEPEIRHALIYNEHQSFVEYKIMPEDVRSDTAAYSEFIVHRKLPNKSEDVRLTLSEAMTNRCEGQFLWLKMQEESLRRGMNKKQLQHAIANTPSGLDHLYDHNWTRISRLGTWASERAFTLLRWAAFALRPLTVCEITEAALIVESDDFQWEDLPDDVDDDYIDTEILGLCSPLLEVRNNPIDPSPSRRTVHLPHFSVRQYLLCRLPLPAWIRQNDRLRASYEQSQNTLLATACLRYISFHHVWADFAHGSPPRLGVSFRTYAATTWYQHANSGLPNDAETVRLCMGFMSRANPAWDPWRALIESEDAERQDNTAETISPGPLYYAIKLRLNGVAISLMTEHNVKETSSLGRSALGVACANGCMEVISVLLDKGANFTVASDRGWTPLNSASVNGHIEVVKLLLEKGADMAVANNDGWTPLNSASSKGHFEVAKLLLEKGADIAIANDDGWTPINSASANGHVEVVRLLIEKEADITSANEDGWTPLYSASCNGHVEVVELLVGRGADIAIVNKNGWTPLNSASANGHLEVIKLLLKEGADITVANNEGWTPINSAAANGHVEVVKLLLENGANIMVTNDGGWTPLYSASGNGHVKVAEVLLEKGADVTSANKDGWTPLNSASANGHLEVIKLLLKEGADITVANNEGWTPINSAAANGHVEVVKLLLENGANIMVTNDGGWTPLYSASGNGHVKVAEVLLEKGADVTSANKDGWTPLNSASANGHLEVIKLLLKEGADITVANNEGWTPLNSASANGHVEVVKLLLEHGPVVSTANKNGWTSLYSASANGHFEVVKLLLDRGADMSVASKNGWTPLNSASANGHFEVVKLLLKKGADIAVANKSGWTSVNLASNGGHYEVVKLLLDTGADIAVVNKNGWTPLYSASVNSHVEVVKLLLDRGADMSVASRNGWTPLNTASANGHFEVVALLLKRGADMAVANKNGWTPLNSASGNGHFEVVKLLLEKGADLAADNIGQTPLNLASCKGQVEVVKLLLGVPSSDPNQTDRLGRTSLFLASRYGQRQVVQVLLSDQRTILGIRDWYGSTSLCAAVANGHSDVVKLLIARGATIENQDGAGRDLIWLARRTGNPEVLQLLLKNAERAASRVPDSTLCGAAFTPFDPKAAWCDALRL
ncbi:hypothetical protein PCL_07389 [Purpureocillium lilacinum]|uniref:Peptidase A2 domain-containing protein n=1 Tax=Purpureocillium lilacinum TaxID=33203 RepID=A0A2U3DS50_PURLI|nr:hypothetical protein PCL_07389 [Purpureocillium lilacinum]